MSDFIVSYLFWVIVVVIIAVPLGLMLFFRYWQRKDTLIDIKTLVAMTVSLPRQESRGANVNETAKDFKELIAPMEQFLASLTTTIHQRNFIDWLFSTPAHVSLEIISVGGVISFHILCPKRIKTIVERQVHSYFPHAEITYGAPPPLVTVDNPVLAGVVFEQTKSYILPLKTYRYLEADPLNGITNALTKLPDQATAAIQILLRPISDSWRAHTHIASQHVAASKLHLVNSSAAGRLVGTVFEVIKKPSDQDQSSRQYTAQQEELMRALQEKGSKTGFEVIMRAVAAAPDETVAEEALRVIISSFSQFYSPQLNGLRYRRPKPERIGRDYLLRLFTNAKKMILNIEEIASIYHFPTKELDTPGVKWLTSRTLPAPANLPTEGIVIGESRYRGQVRPVCLKDEDRRRHLFMIGKTGTGKTTLFENMIEQDMHAGKGLCFIDPLGDAVENLLKKVPTSRADDVILFDPSDTEYPLGLNLLEYRYPEERDFLIQEVIEIFYKLFDPNRTGIVGPQWEHWARNAALTVMSQPDGGSLIDIPRLFTDDAFRTRAISHVRDPVVKMFWEQQLAKTADFHKSEMYNYFISKFGRFMTNDLMRNIIGQKQSSFQLRELMDQGKILLVNLAKGKIGEINSNLLGLVLVSKIQTAAFSRADIPEDKRRDFYLYVDEFQNFTTSTFATILAEARKYHLNLNITNQYFAQLTEQIRDAVIGNVGTLVAYRIGAEDAEFLVHEMPGVTVEDLTNLDRFQAYVKLLVDLTPTRPFSMSGVRSPTEGTIEMANWIKLATRQKFARFAVEPLAGAPKSQN